jgi:hypothetical protein
VDDLERRLARLEGLFAPLEEELARRTQPTTTDDGPGSEDPDTGLEGARLVALQLLSAGHGRQVVADYLRETFGFDEAGAVRAVEGSTPD